MNINHFTVGGNLTRNPELRRLPGGRAMTRFTLAVNQYASDGMQTYERCDFIPITSYGAQAENDVRFLRKGQAVVVECAVHSWHQEGKNDAKRKSGFNFEAVKVHYLMSDGASKDTVGRQAVAGRSAEGTCANR